MSHNVSSSISSRSESDFPALIGHPKGEHLNGLDDKAEVSVIIPCYKQAHYLAEAIGSVLTQTYFNYEIIVIDDGSPDDTAAVAAQYPVRYIYQENQGLSGARNTGIDNSRGQYLVFLDADDRLTPNALQVGIDCFHLHPKCAFVSGHHRYIKGDGSLLNEYPPEPIDQNYYLALLKRNYIGMHATVMYQRHIFDIVGGFDTSLLSCEDYDLYLRIARQFSICRHHQITAEYRWHDANMTSNASRMLATASTVLQSQQPYISNNPTYLRAYRSGLKFCRYYFAYHLLTRIYRSLISGRLKNSWTGLTQLFKYVPVWLSTLSLELQTSARLLLFSLKIEAPLVVSAEDSLATSSEAETVTGLDDSEKITKTLTSYES